MEVVCQPQQYLHSTNKPISFMTMQLDKLFLDLRLVTHAQYTLNCKEVRSKIPLLSHISIPTLRSLQET